MMYANDWSGGEGPARDWPDHGHVDMMYANDWSGREGPARDWPDHGHVDMA